MRKPKVGERMFCVWVGSGPKTEKNVEGVVMRVGRKYFYITISAREIPFHISSWIENGHIESTYAVFESKQAWEENELARNLSRQIGDSLTYRTHPVYRSRFKLSQLLEAAKILGITTGDK